MSKAKYRFINIEGNVFKSHDFPLSIRFTECDERNNHSYIVRARSIFPLFAVV